jgi:N-acetylglucosaminyl-diphospho-decaprenol L-rhamnosyltransferase
MTMSIIVVSYNAREHLERCLESLELAAPTIPYDVTVVDNASTDGAAAFVRNRWPGIRVIEQQRNIGFAAANNVGIRATTGDLILLLNSDTIVPSGALEALARRLAAHPQAAAAGPRLVDASGRVELSFGSMMAPLTELRQKAVGTLLARNVRPAVRWAEKATREEQYVDWVSGACLLVHRRDAEAAGLLDERYFLYTEDVDFCAAIRARGRKVLFTPEAEIMHVRGRSRATAPETMNVAYRRSHLAFYQKHHPRWAPLLRMYLRIKGQLPLV